MAPASYRATAPGKLMLLGEHAVLHGRASLVCAVDQYMTAELHIRSDDQITIRSDLGEYKSRLTSLTPDNRFQFVLAAVKSIWKAPAGFDLTIRSQFSHQVGLGSSAAVTAVVVGLLSAAQELFLNPLDIFKEGLSVIHSVQGSGSGADLAASVFGGVLVYRAEPLEINPLDNPFPISLFYSGKKTPTSQVIQLVENRRQQNPVLFDSIFDIMGKSVFEASAAIKKKDWQRLGDIFNINQGLMDAMGVNTMELAEINFHLRQNEHIFGSKISGSGLGDCVVAVGEYDGEDFGYERIPVSVSQKGLTVEKV